VPRTEDRRGGPSAVLPGEPNTRPSEPARPRCFIRTGPAALVIHADLEDQQLIRARPREPGSPCRRVVFPRRSRYQTLGRWLSSGAFDARVTRGQERRTSTAVRNTVASARLMPRGNRRASIRIGVEKRSAFVNRAAFSATPPPASSSGSSQVMRTSQVMPTDVPYFGPLPTLRVPYPDGRRRRVGPGGAGRTPVWPRGPGGCRWRRSAGEREREPQRPRRARCERAIVGVDPPDALISRAGAAHAERPTRKRPAGGTAQGSLVGFVPGGAMTTGRPYSRRGYARHRGESVHTLHTGGTSFEAYTIERPDARFHSSPEGNPEFRRLPQGSSAPVGPGRGKAPPRARPSAPPGSGGAFCVTIVRAATPEP
jgi:hypothetical protein